VDAQLRAARCSADPHLIVVCGVVGASGPLGDISRLARGAGGVAPKPDLPCREESWMITRIDRLGVALPPPSEPDPDGAAAVRELILAGGKGALSADSRQRRAARTGRARR
jgi:hypothetical protein